MSPLAAVLLAGCGTLINGTHQDIEIHTDPPAAHYQVKPNGPSGTTPASVHLARSEFYSVLIQKEGYEPQVVRLSRDMSGWIWGNLPLGVIWALVDGFSGGAYKLSPTMVSATLVPIESDTTEEGR